MFSDSFESARPKRPTGLPAYLQVLELIVNIVGVSCIPSSNVLYSNSNQRQTFRVENPTPSSISKFSLSPTQSSLLLFRTVRPIHEIVKHLSHGRRLHFHQYCHLSLLVGMRTYLTSLITYWILELRTSNALVFTSGCLILRSELRACSRCMIVGSTSSTIGCLDVLDTPGFARNQVSEVAWGMFILIVWRHGGCCLATGSILGNGWFYSFKFLPWVMGSLAIIYFT